MGPLLAKMGSTLSLLANDKNARILLLGMDSAGKTTILYRLKLNETINTIPTIGFNVEEMSPVKNVTFTMWDVGGQQKIRGLWRHYYQGAKGVIFVIDSSDVDRVSEAKRELFYVLKDEGIEAGLPVLVVANKQDLPNALKASVLVEKLGLRELVANPWYVQEMSAVNGDGLHEGLAIMADMVKKFLSASKKPGN